MNIALFSVPDASAPVAPSTTTDAPSQVRVISTLYLYISVYLCTYIYIYKYIYIYIYICISPSSLY